MLAFVAATLMAGAVAVSKSLPAKLEPPIDGVPSSLGSTSDSSVRHSDEQPSKLTVFESSQTSGAMIMPSPQIGAQVDTAPVQAQPVSIAQAAEQPSPGVWLPMPWSQVSAPTAMTPSPQVAVHTEGTAAVQV